MRHFQGLATALFLGVAPAFAVAQVDLPAGSASGRSTTNNQAQQDIQGTQSQRGDDATAQGRDPRQPGAQAGREATDRLGQAGQAGVQFDDQLFLAAAREGGQAEILFSQLALERASSDEVKQFARQMIEDHEAVNQQLMGGAGIDRDPTARPGAPAARPGDPAARPGAVPARPGTATDRPGAGLGTEPQARTEPPAGLGNPQAPRDDAQAGAGGLAGEAIEGRQAARPAFGAMGPEGLNSAGCRAEYAILASKQGEEFDKCYIKGQVAAHMCAVGLYEAESQMGQEYKELATQTLPKLKQHLEMAKQICEKVEPSSASRQGGQNGTEAPRRPQ